MHHYFVGLCADLHRAGDRTGDWVCSGRPMATSSLRVTANPATTSRCCSSSSAERVEAAGRSPVARLRQPLAGVDHLGVHPMDTSDPAHPQIVHAFVHRDSDNYRIENLGHAGDPQIDIARHDPRAHVVPDEAAMLVCPAGFAGAGLFHVCLFGWSLLGFGAVYASIARRGSTNRGHTHLPDILQDCPCVTSRQSKQRPLIGQTLKRACCSRFEPESSGVWESAVVSEHQNLVRCSLAEDRRRFVFKVMKQAFGARTSTGLPTP